MTTKAAKKVSGTELILNLLDDPKLHTTNEIKKLFKKHGLPANSHKAALNFLKKEGHISQNVDGTWRFAWA